MTSVSPMRPPMVGDISSSMVQAAVSTEFAALLDPIEDWSDPQLAAIKPTMSFGEWGILGRPSLSPMTAGASPLPAPPGINQTQKGADGSRAATCFKLASDILPLLPAEQAKDNRWQAPRPNIGHAGATEPSASSCSVHVPISARATAAVRSIENQCAADTKGSGSPRLPARPNARPSSDLSLSISLEGGEASILCRGELPPAELRMRLRAALARHHIDLASLHINGADQPIRRVWHGDRY